MSLSPHVCALRMGKTGVERVGNSMELKKLKDGDSNFILIQFIDTVLCYPDDTFVLPILRLMTK